MPAGLSHIFRLPRSFFSRNERSELLLLAGVHPNCESMTLLISDGKQYRGIGHYLKIPFSQAMAEFAVLSKKVGPLLRDLGPNKPLQRILGQWRCIRTFGAWLVRSGDFRALWPPYRDVVLRTVSQKYGAVDGKGRLRTPEQALTPEELAVTEKP